MDKIKENAEIAEIEEIEELIYWNLSFGISPNVPEIACPLNNVACPKNNVFSFSPSHFIDLISSSLYFIISSKS